MFTNKCTLMLQSKILVFQLLEDHMQEILILTRANLDRKLGSQKQPF